MAYDVRTEIFNTIFVGSYTVTQANDKMTTFFLSL
jgi:hypothetical protein